MNKVSVIGAGNVGASTAQCIAQQELADVALIDVAGNLATGKALDLAQSAAVQAGDGVLIGGADYALTAGSQVVVITAGLARKPGMSREDLLATNARIVADVTSNCLKYSPDAIFVVVTNPLDAMAFLAWKRSGLPSHRVIGMAGVLDSGRFQRFIADELKVSAEDVRAMVLGGHGDLMVPLPRFSTVNGIPITSLMSKARIKELCERTRNGGAEIVQYLQSGSAYYAPGASVTMMVEAILKNKRRLLPCSVHANGLYGLGDVYIGLPAIIGAWGVEQVLAPALNIVELRALKRSAASAAAAQTQVLKFALETKE